MTVCIRSHDLVNIGSVLFGVLFEFWRQGVVARRQAVICRTLKDSEMFGLCRDHGDGLDTG